MGVILVFQPEHNLPIAVAAGAFRRCLDGDCNIGLLVAAHWRHLTPVGLACYLPFAFGIDGDGLLMLRTEGASYRGTTCQFVVSGDAFEVAPALCRLIMCHGRNWHLNGKIVLSHAIKRTAFYIGWHGATAYNRTDAETISKRPLAYRLHRLREHDTLEHTTPLERLYTNTQYTLRNVEDAHNTLIIAKRITTYMLNIRRQFQFAGEIIIEEGTLRDCLQIFRKMEFSLEFTIIESQNVYMRNSIVKRKRTIETTFAEGFHRNCS